MSKRWEMLCTLAGPVTIIIFVGAWTFSIGWLFPPSASMRPEEIASVFQNNTTGIRIGMLLLMYAGALNAAFSAIIMVYMLKIKEASPALAYTQFASGTVTILLFIIPAQVFTTTAFRPDRLVEITQFGNDLGWLILDMVNSTAIVQVLALGAAVLCDKSPKPVFPRWFGFFNFSVGLLFVPASLVTFFKSGPFSWAGVFGWYLGLTIFGAWYFVTAYLLVKAIKEHGPRTDA